MKLNVNRIVNADSWKSALRELVLIVAGVLIAISLSNLNEGRKDRTREHATLVQLLNVTRENEQRAFEVASADSFVTSNIVRVRDVVNEKRPMSDSILLWMKGSFAVSEFSPILGVYDAAATTGNLNLVRNDSLRDLVVRVAGELHGVVEQIRGLEPLQLPIGSATIYDLESKGIWKTNAPNDTLLTAAQKNALMNDTVFAKALYVLRPLHGRHYFFTRRARDSLRTLRLALERELKVPPLEPKLPATALQNRISR